MITSAEKPAGSKRQQKRTQEIRGYAQEKMQGLVKMKKGTDEQFDRPDQ